MKLILTGHDYRYAVEQMLFTLFPGEKPEYEDVSPEDNRIEVKLSRAQSRTSAICCLIIDGKAYKGISYADNSAMTDDISRDRLCQFIIKNSIYRASIASGMTQPPWGALTGVRPGKIMCSLLREYGNEKTALRHFETDYCVTHSRAELCLETSRVTMQAEALLQPKDICLYIGIPFCPTRCSYCSFVSQSVEKSMALIPPFLEALRQEIDATAEIISSLGLRVVSIYFGGGTPTTLSAAQLDSLLSHLEGAADLSSLTEFTVEAGRPDTITADKLAVLRAHGVDRVSVNPQTMDDHVLEVIGRRHSSCDIYRAIELVRKEGGMAINMDMIAGLPDDTEGGFRSSLDSVISIAPENITVHTLSLKRGSGITMNGTRIPDGIEVAQMLDYAAQALPAAGYSPYYLYRQKNMSGGFENVGWTLPGRTNLYNICIMEELCSIIALGGGASTKLISPGSGRNIRIVSPKYPLEYIQSIERISSDKKKIQDFYK